jgi:NitT/TauT family transport system ATP-binding protein
MGLVSETRPKLSIQEVCKTFTTRRDEVYALDHVSLEIQEGEFVCLVGPSGCGKSTLLNLIAGLDVPDAGVILANGQAVNGPGPDRMVMFQESALFPWLNVVDNVMFGLRLKPNLSKSARIDVATYYLRLVGLERFARASIHALAPNPRALLMDEPFAALDAMTREQLYGDLQRIWQERRKTIIFVTHNVRESVCLADRVVLFSPHPGRIREEFTIELPRPRDINSVEVAEVATRITRALKSHAEESASEVA